LRNVVLTLPSSGTAAREALFRCLERFPSDVEEAPASARPARLRELARDGDVEWIMLVDPDIVPAATLCARCAGQPGPVPRSSAAAR